ncbi:enoyl-ACP reductase FabI [Alicyclobacillus fastidiosus]|uniref:Enoyl-[acyl-carrier-protein] reductase [NADH] n=1 Tax=Alicyclobacillus fastidiosus TaxID=392011 RepID=A0ABV5ADR8_9BACL|nr:enoyl-ACP reductase FabI [Alicyclobacillus fastidiosus]WEH08627.1 enoyl-ACP reductase FabI [Alicyclobacillus fastidiosus]
MALLTGKTIVVMGVANKRSIGWGVAASAAKQGANLVLTHRSERAGEQIRKLLAELPDVSASIVRCDVTDDASIEEAFAQIGEATGRIDGIVHSIAHANVEDLQGEFVGTSREGFLLAHNISAYSLVAVARAARPLMTSGGGIVTMSYLGGERAVENYNVMGVAKAALESAVRYLAKDLGKDNIRVNAISAGPIRTLAAKGVRGFNDVLHTMQEKAPLGRNVDAEEVGDVTAFFLSDLSRGITGEVIHVDGGYHIVGL